MADEYLPLVLVAATLCTTAIVAVAVAALARRRTRPYYLVVGALGALLLRSLLGVVTDVGVVAGHTHHFVEHALDVAAVAMLFAAVWLTRRNDPRTLADRYRTTDE